MFKFFDSNSECLPDMMHFVRTLLIMSAHCSSRKAYLLLSKRFEVTENLLSKRLEEITENFIAIEEVRSYKKFAS